MIPQTFTVRPILLSITVFLLASFSVLQLLVVVSVRQIKLTRVGSRAHVKIASRRPVVSYRIVSYRTPAVMNMQSSSPHQRQQHMARLRLALHRHDWKFSVPLKHFLCPQSQLFRASRGYGDDDATNCSFKASKLYSLQLSVCLFRSLGRHQCLLT